MTGKEKTNCNLQPGPDHRQAKVDICLGPRFKRVLISENSNNKI